jgi:hypothetical protein
VILLIAHRPAREGGALDRGAGLGSGGKRRPSRTRQRKPEHLSLFGCRYHLYNPGKNQVELIEVHSGL